MDEDDHLDIAVEKALKKGLTEGSVLLHIVKCGVSGPPETGKSHVRALMLDLDRPKERQSTAVATEADQVTPDIQRAQLDRVSEDFLAVPKESPGKRSKWGIIKDKYMAVLIANTLHDDEYRKKGKTTEPILSSEFISRCKIVKDVKKHLKRRHGNPKKKKNGLNTIRIIYFVDTGGQPQFQEILPNFIKCDINLLVHNLSQELSYCPEFTYVFNEKKYTVPERMKLSNSEIIEQSVRSIASNISTSDNKPHVAIVGTFKDKYNSDPEKFKHMLKEKSKVINELLDQYVGDRVGECGMLTPERSQDQQIFAIDASKEGWDSNHECLDNLKTQIQQCADNRSIEIPIRYFLFLQGILAFAKSKPHGKKHYVTLKECYDVAAGNDICMTKSDVKDALIIFNDCNLILYFIDILENIAFVKPGFLYGVVTSLIVESFECESLIMKNDFRRTGVFTPKILNDVVSHQLQSDDFTKENFIDLLKGLFIIAEIDIGCYFMPCVLPLENCTSSELISIQECMKSNNIDGPLIFSFPHKMSPRGLFCALIVALVADPRWELSVLSKGMYRHRNLINFEFLWSSEHIGQVTIIDKKSHFEVYTTTDASFCPNIKQTVYEAFKKACENMNYNDFTFIGLPCYCKEDPKFHSTEVIKHPGNIWKERCATHRRKQFITMAHERVVWFQKDSSYQGSPMKFLRLLCAEVAQKTNEWRLIALNLQISPVQINRIALECRDEIQNCFVRVFEQWHKQGNPPYTWDTIVEVLESPSVNEAALAQELREKYIFTPL